MRSRDARRATTTRLPRRALPIVNGFEGTALSAHNAAYGLDLRLPLGGVDASGISHTSLLLRHYTSLVSQSIDGPGADTSPYLYNDRDRIDDETFEIEHSFAHAMLTLQYDVRNERLATDFLPGVVNDEAILRSAPHTLALRTLDDDDAPPAPDVAALGLGQTQRAAVLRYTYEPAASLHLTAAGYYSRYSLFGSSLDPRFGAVYTPDSRTVVRFSAGTTYQSPQLPELFVPSPLPVVVGNYVSVGNPHLQPDRATEYEVGLDHLFELGSRRTDVSVDFYRVNLRNPASVLQPALDPSCGPASAGGDGTACPLSYPVNAGDGVYTGIELQGEREIANATSLRAGFAVRSAYLTRVPATIQDGTLVPGEQSLGLPLQKATLSIVHSPLLGFTAYGRVVYEGLYNELDQPQYATIDGGVGYRWRRARSARLGDESHEYVRSALHDTGRRIDVRRRRPGDRNGRVCVTGHRDQRGGHASFLAVVPSTGRLVDEDVDGVSPVTGSKKRSCVAVNVPCERGRYRPRSTRTRTIPIDQ